MAPRAWACIRAGIRLGDPVGAVQCGVGQGCLPAAGPTDLDPVHPLGLPNADQEPGVIRRREAAAALDLTVQDTLAGVDLDRRADRGAIGPGSDQLKADPVARVRLVQQDRRSACPSG